MVDQVKGRPTGRRAEPARRTRASIVTAARELFVADGYATTTIAAIAEEAGVAVQTVYAVFGTKRAVLSEVIDRAIAGDDEPVAVNDRPWMRAVWTAPTARERLVAYAAAVRRIHAGAGDALVALDAAASSDPEVRALAEETERRRRSGAEAVVRSIREVGSLRQGLRPAAAVDVLWLLNGPQVHHQLVRRAGWSEERYERWLADAMVGQLLGGAGP